jgi:uncharacterized protein
VLATTLTAAAVGAPGAVAGQAVQQLEFKASDGVVLYGTVSGEAPLRPRPLIVEYSPYGQGPGGPPAGPGFNYVQVHARGTGRSGGAWNIMGPREQLDIVESLGWLCHRSWSSGRIGLYGFSASAIAAYHAMRRTSLPCVKTAALLAGTSSIYRDLVFIGGMPNFVPAVVVSTAIGSAFLNNLPGRFGSRPQSVFESSGGVKTAMEAFLAHQTQDVFWRERQFPGPSGATPRFPVLAATGFYDVESRGPFETFKTMRGRGSHLLVMGAHDGAAGRTKGALAHFKRWFEHYLLGTRNGIDKEPAVQLYVGHGSHERLRAGEWTKVNATNWPVPGTAWRTLHVDSRRSGSARSLNDGTLGLARPADVKTQSEPTVPSNTLATDPYTTSTVTSTQETNLTEATSLTYSSAPLDAPVMSVGPAALKVRLSSTALETDIVAVLSDVAPDGASHPVAAGRLRSTFTKIDRARSVTDRSTGEIVQPYNDLSAKQIVPPGEAHDYYVEFWPIGNRFARGHRIRLTLAGTPYTFLPTVPALNSIVVGGRAGARLQFPVLPGSDLCGALGAAPCPVTRATRRRCLSRRSPIGPRNIGRIRLGLTRRRLSRVRVKSIRRTRLTRVYCVTGSRKRVTAVFSRAGARAGVKLVTTTARGHRMRGVGPGASGRRLRSRFHALRDLSHSLFRARPGSRRLFGIRRGTVRFVAVADKRLLGNHAALRRHLRRAGL